MYAHTGSEEFIKCHECASPEGQRTEQEQHGRQWLGSQQWKPFVGFLQINVNT